MVHEMTWLRPHPPRKIFDYWKEMYPEISTVPENMEKISTCAYRLLGHFTLPENAWRVGYYGPLEARLQRLREKYGNDPAVMAVIDAE